MKRLATFEPPLERSVRRFKQHVLLMAALVLNKRDNALYALIGGFVKDIEVQHDFFHSDVDWVDVTERKGVKVVRVLVDNGNDYVSVYFTTDDLRAMLRAIESSEKFEN